MPAGSGSGGGAEPGFVLLGAMKGIGRNGLRVPDIAADGGTWTVVWPVTCPATRAAACAATPCPATCPATCPAILSIPGRGSGACCGGGIDGIIMASAAERGYCSYRDGAGVCSNPGVAQALVWSCMPVGIIVACAVASGAAVACAVAIGAGCADDAIPEGKAYHGGCVYPAAWAVVDGKVDAATPYWPWLPPPLCAAVAISTIQTSTCCMSLANRAAIASYAPRRCPTARPDVFLSTASVESRTANR